jgi:hypothetical protein
MPFVRTAAILLTAGLLVNAGIAAPAEKKRVYRVDSVIATLKGRTFLFQAKGAVQSGGWRGAKLHAMRGDARTLVLEFVAEPPTPGAAVITGLLPVIANARIRARRGVVAVRVVAQANDVTTQILH